MRFAIAIPLALAATPVAADDLFLCRDQEDWAVTVSFMDAEENRCVLDQIEGQPENAEGVWVCSTETPDQRIEIADDFLFVYTAEGLDQPVSGACTRS